jgi:arabinofuranosyltransferase
MRRSWIVVAAIVVAAIAIAWLIRFGCDDAYISYVYSRALVRGDGLTWFGAHVEGYTNFAWVLWVALGEALGADPLRFAWAGSLAALAGVLVTTYRIGVLRASPTAGACAAALLATNFTFLAYGTSGLETMAQTALIALAWWQTERLRELEVKRLALLSLTIALALAMRLDSAVPCTVFGVVVAHRLVRARAGVRLWAAAIAPALVLVGAWLVWKLAYYGDVLPNTFHAKVGVTAVSLAQGARYASAFLHAYWLWPLLVAALVVRRRLTLAWAIALAWFAYVILVGGDFMEFRFFVPVLPALVTIVAELVTMPAPARVPAPGVRAIAAVALLAALSWRHAATFEGAEDRSYDSIHELATFYGAVPDGNWSRVGTPLHDVLAGTGATLACNGAGAIPYYADLPTVDQLGLNDAWVARHGTPADPSYARPGHQRFATYDDLVSRHVTFVIGRPTVVRRGWLSAHRMHADISMWLVTILGPAPAPASARVVAAPLDDRDALLLWYLTPSDAVDARIRAAGWEERDLGASR